MLVKWVYLHVPEEGPHSRQPSWHSCHRALWLTETLIAILIAVTFIGAASSLEASLSSWAFRLLPEGTMLLPPRSWASNGERERRRKHVLVAEVHGEIHNKVGHTK